jgi:hypothetical protein
MIHVDHFDLTRYHSGCLRLSQMTTLHSGGKNL